MKPASFNTDNVTLVKVFCSKKKKRDFAPRRHQSSQIYDFATFAPRRALLFKRLVYEGDKANKLVCCVMFTAYLSSTEQAVYLSCAYSNQDVWDDLRLPPFFFFYPPLVWKCCRGSIYSSRCNEPPWGPGRTMWRRLSTRAIHYLGNVSFCSVFSGAPLILGCLLACRPGTALVITVNHHSDVHTWTAGSSVVYMQGQICPLYAVVYPPPTVTLCPSCTTKQPHFFSFLESFSNCGRSGLVWPAPAQTSKHPPGLPPPALNIYTIQLSAVHSYRSPLFTCRLWLWLMDRLQDGWFSGATSRKRPSVCSCSRGTRGGG